MNILFVGAHCDDVELGAGATVRKMTRDPSNHVTVVVLSRRSLLIGFDLLDCMERSMQELGVSDFRVFDFPDGSMEGSRQGIWESLRVARDMMRHDLVICPSPDDHQDHCTVFREVVRVFQESSLFTYCIQRSDQTFAPTAFVRVEEEDLAAKIASLRHYPEGLKSRSYFDPDLIRSQARVNGCYVGADYAEGFSVRRWIA